MLNKDVAIGKARSRQTESAWLQVAVLVGFLAAVMAVFLVFARTPLVASWLPADVWFKSALVLHVNLFIFVWLGIVACLYWLEGVSPRQSNRYLLVLIIGMALWFASASGEAPAVLNNYFPVFKSPAFYVGFGLILLSLLLFLPSRLRRLHNLCVSGGMWTQLLADALVFPVLATALALVMGYARMPAEALSPQGYFELFMWGPGHLWQLFVMQLFLLMMLNLSTAQYQATAWQARIFVSLLLVLFAASLSLYAFDIAGFTFRQGFTQVMRVSGLIILGPVLLLAWCNRSGLWGRVTTFAALLYCLGVAFGLLIRDDSLMVPAHYHAMTAAVNLLAMITVLNRLSGAMFGFIRRWLLPVYCIGGFSLASGLAGLGYLSHSRKTVVDLWSTGSWIEQSFLLALVLGGLLAVVGVFLFLGKMFLVLRKAPANVPVVVGSAVYER